MKIVTKRARRGLLLRNQWATVIIADNGEPLFRSETYGNRDDAVHAGELVAHDAMYAAHTIED